MGIIATLFLGIYSVSMRSLEDLMALLSLPPNSAQLILRQYPSFITNENDHVKLKSLFIVKASLINQRDRNDCFVTDYAAEEANILKRCLETFTQLIARPEVQSYLTNPSWESRKTLRDNLLHGENGARYAFLYWFHHISSSNEQLDHLTLRLLRELLSNR